MSSGIDRDLKRLWGTSEKDVYAVGTFNILHFDGSSWKPIDSPLGKTEVWSNIFGIDNEIFVIGQETILHYKDNKWEQMDSGVTSGAYLQSIWQYISHQMKMSIFQHFIIQSINIVILNGVKFIILKEITQFIRC